MARPRPLILLVLALALLARLPRLETPLLGIQGWRQADTAAFARNYDENGFRLMYPQVDWGGDTEGYVESEFPLYSFLVALAYRAFGMSESYGRLLSIACSLGATLFLYLLVRDVIDRKTALFSSILYAAIPLNVYYGRAFMPESMMLMASVAGIYFFVRWTTRGRRLDFLLSAGFTSLACLLKIPALYLGLPLLYLATVRFGKRALVERRLWLYAALVLVPVTLWYYHAHQLYRATGLTFGIWAYGQDKWGNWDLVLSLGYWDNLLFKRLAERNFTWVGFALFLVGLFLPRRESRERVFDYWLAAVCVYFFIVGKGNAAHEYYQLPFLLPSVVYIGKVYGRYFNFARNRTATVLLCVCLVGILVAGGLRYRYFYLEQENPEISPAYALAQDIQEKTQESSRLISLLGGDPSIFYWAHRKGWNVRPEDATTPLLDDLVRRGASYALGCRRNFDRAGALDAFARVRARGPSLLPADYDCFLIPLSAQTPAGTLTP